jgi:hypothetical protein
LPRFLHALVRALHSATDGAGFANVLAAISNS